MSNILEALINQVADAAAERIVDRETEGLTVEERLRRVEVKAVTAEANLRAAQILYRELSENLDDQAQGLMAIIFQLFGHVTGHKLTDEQIEQVRLLSNEAYEAEDANFSPSDAGRITESAVRQVLGG